MQKHVTLAAVLNIVYRGLHIVLAFGLFFLGIFFEDFLWAILQMAHTPMHDIPFEVFGVMPMILIPVSIFMLIISVAGVTGGIGLLRHREWGRIVLMVVSFFNILDVPFGTILGVYTLWVLMNDETIAMVSPGAAAPSVHASQAAGRPA
jgi:hypothetical protein